MAGDLDDEMARKADAWNQHQDDVDDSTQDCIEEARRDERIRQTEALRRESLGRGKPLERG